MKHGIILVKKEVGMTSYDVIRILKRKFNTSRIGHAGTLDPFASGLLIIGINEGTKILPFIENEYKEYIGELVLGKLTDTYDVTGKVIKSKKTRKHNFDEVNKVLNSFKGEIMQTPPIYSAIKVNGKALYKYARENKEVDIKARKQIIYDVRLIHYKKDHIYFYVKCNKGTYIRSLAVDLANKLNEYGYLNNLERIGIGPYKILNVKKVNDLSLDHLISIEDAVKFKYVYVKDKKDVINGIPLKLNETDDLVLIMYKDHPLAIYALNKSDMIYYCKRGFRYEGI